MTKTGEARRQVAFFGAEGGGFCRVRTNSPVTHAREHGSQRKQNLVKCMLGFIKDDVAATNYAYAYIQL
jgi:hypothetical protein